MNSYLMTDKGLSRNTNQDDVLSVTKENGDSLYVLCDGMGGHAGGAVACKRCINIFKNDFKKSGIYLLYFFIKFSYKCIFV